MYILSLCCIVLALAYGALMLLYRFGWQRQASFKIPEAYEAQTRISVIIPARNEAKHIGNCIRSLLAQDYPAPLLQIIIVDDHSQDDTATLALREGGGRVQVISLAEHVGNRPINAYKKEALTAGIAASDGELIVTSDADCVAGPHWLSHIAACYEEEQAAMIIGPVNMDGNGSESAIFQSLDFMMMQAITMAAHQLKLGGMANGANLAFSRKSFDAVQGYAGTLHLASGDDFLLLHKMAAAFPDGIHYLKAREAIVHTDPQPNWASFLRQRIRWASKSGHYTDRRLTAILGVVYFFNLSLLALAIAACFHPAFFRPLLTCLVGKVILELFLLWPAAGFFKKRRELFAFPVLQPLHILYISVTGLLGLKGGYRWKGRRVH